MQDYDEQILKGPKEVFLSMLYYIFYFYHFMKSELSLLLYTEKVGHRELKKQDEPIQVTGNR